MNDNLQYLVSENEVINEELRKEKIFLDTIKREEKNLKVSLENIKSNISNLKRAILIKNREISKHKINLKVNNERFKGVVSQLSKTCESIIGDRTDRSQKFDIDT